MRTIFRLVCVLVIFSLCASAAQAAFVGDLINYAGYENTVSTTALGGLYKKVSGSWVQDDHTLPNNLTTDHAIVAVLKATKVYNWPIHPGVTDDAYTGEFTAYLALKVVNVTGNQIIFGAGTSSGWDPFGKLGANEVLGIWLEGTKDFSVNAPIAGSGNRAVDVSWASDGSLFATFGFGPEPLEDKAVGYVSGVLLSVDAKLEVLQNPMNLNWLTVSNYLGPNHLVINSLFFHTYPPPGAAWRFGAGDQMRFRVTPEPGSLAVLAGLGLAGAVGLGLRRRRSG